MAVTKLSIAEFLQMAFKCPVLDVRSPGEFKHAHIPGAYSLPLFTDEERKIVGTAYKQESREKAIKAGLKYFGTKMTQMVEEAEAVVTAFKPPAADNNVAPFSHDGKQPVVVHCWRGGMRSAGVAWLLDLYGFNVYTLAGGYKVFRKWVLEQFEKEYPFFVIGGYTGSGKTELLQALKNKGETVIDLEALASHKGSSFGSLGQGDQPTQEMFENNLAVNLNSAAAKCRYRENENMDNRKSSTKNVIWIEDESQRIGNVNIPAMLYRRKQASPVYFIDISFEERLNHIVACYGRFEKEQLVNAIIRIKKRLGGLETKTAVGYLIEDDVKNCFAVLLKYYDKWYLKGLHQRENLEVLLNKIPCTNIDSKENAIRVLESCLPVKVVS
ncbi:MAG TPA: tRNA 2-selenouridine(34) synthase MnmH [Panacibacter sp.]|nr:tRNA 2-selenouridine(34) synthase MnmH [Panacibacter sp.]